MQYKNRFRHLRLKFLYSGKRFQLGSVSRAALHRNSSPPYVGRRGPVTSRCTVSLRNRPWFQGGAGILPHRRLERRWVTVGNKVPPTGAVSWAGPVGGVDARERVDLRSGHRRWGFTSVCRPVLTRAVHYFRRRFDPAPLLSPSPSPLRVHRCHGPRSVRGWGGVGVSSPDTWDPVGRCIWVS